MLLKFRPIKNKTDKQVLKALTTTGFHDFTLKQLKKIVTLEELKEAIRGGEKVRIHHENPTDRLICCDLADDPWDGIIPRVVKSNHPRFIVGTRFDYGFMCVALRDGFSIFYNSK